MPVFIAPLLFAAAQLAALPIVYPEPQEMTRLAGRFPLDEQVVVLVPKEPSAEDLSLARMFVAEMSDHYALALRIQRLSSLPTSARVVVMGSFANPLVKESCARMQLQLTQDDPGPEGYILRVDERVVLVAGSDDPGAFYGLQSLRQLVSRNSSLDIPALMVRDWPHKSFRGIKLYLPGHENLPFFKRFLRDFMALYKYNKVILEMDAAMRLDRHPELNTGWTELAKDLVYSRRDRPTGPREQYQDSTHHDTADGGILEKAEVAELVSLAAQYHIEVIPEIPSLTHAYYLLTTHRELAEIQDAEWPDTYCPSNPESYKLIFDVLDEYIEVMKPKLIHTGHDEWRMPWGVCPRCKGKDARDLYAEDVNKIHRYLAAKGVRMGIWGDHLLESVAGRGLQKRISPAGYQYEIPGALTQEMVKNRIPKDILIFNWFWNDDEPEGGEANDISLADWGFEQVYGNFTPEIRNYGRRSMRPGVLGGAPSAWVGTTEYNFGKDLVYDFVGSASLLWSKQSLPPEQLAKIVQQRMPEIRRSFRGVALPSGYGEQIAVVKMTALRTSSAKQISALDLHLKSGQVTWAKCTFDLAGDAKSVKPTEEPLMIGEDASSLIFLHASAKPASNQPGHRYLYNFPDTADLLGWYDVVYEDGFVATVPIRYGENILEWNWPRSAKPSTYCYRADPVDCNAEKNGMATLFAFEWVNPRFGKVIKEIRLKRPSGFKDTRGRVIPENAVILAALSITKKRTFPEPVKARIYQEVAAPE
jgi:hypothetical protein